MYGTIINKLTAEKVKIKNNPPCEQRLARLDMVPEKVGCRK
jgi:hypothetical protein